MDDTSKYYDLLSNNNVELRAIGFYHEKEKIKSNIVETKEVSNKDDFLSFCNRHNGKSNIYAGIHERLPGGTNKNAVICVKIIPLDIDSIHPVNMAASEIELANCRTETFSMVEELAKIYGRPSVIMTGNGYQLLWKIRPIIINDSNRDIIEEKISFWIKRIQKKYNSESKKIDQIGDLPRILKVAGTKSVKGNNTTERPFRDSYFVEFNDQISDILRDEILTLDINPIKDKPLKSQIIAKKGQIDKFDYFLKRDNKLSKLYSGNIVGYNSRSEAEMALVCKLVYYEFTDDEIDLVMDNCSIGKWKETNSQYKELTITKARLLIRDKSEFIKQVGLEEVYMVISKWLYMKDFYSIDLILALVLSQKLKGCSPLWMIFVGASGDGKSEMVRMIEHLNFVYKVDQLTPNTLVSGNPQVKDLAPELNDKILLITDFASILSLNGDSQKLIFAQLRNLYDGDAYKDSGAGARKHYSNLRITLIANSTPIINNKILIHQDLGTRELIYRTDYDNTLEDRKNKSLRAIRNEGRKDEMRSEIRTVISSFLNSVTEINSELSPEMLSWLIEKANWLSAMRATTTVDGYSGEIISDVSEEVPTRLIIQLKNIYICLKALDKEYSDDRAKEILLRIINSSAKENRVKIFQYLQSCDTEETTSGISEALRLGKKTIQTECNILWNMNLIYCRKSRVINFGKEQEIDYWSKKAKENEIKEELVI